MTAKYGTDYYQFWKLTSKEQEELLGSEISFGPIRFTVVEFDPASQMYNEQYGIVHVGMGTLNRRGLTELWVPSIDDGAYRLLWTGDSFPSVWEFVRQYMVRTNYYFSIELIRANAHIIGHFEADDSY